MTYTGYCPITMMKERLLIPAADETYDTELESAGEEASNYIDEVIRPFVTSVPLTGEDITDQIKVICADIGSGIFKRRQMPKDFDQGWWLQGIKKLEIFVETNYLLAEEVTSFDTRKVDEILRAFQDKIITKDEARKFLNAITDFTGSTFESVKPETVVRVFEADLLSATEARSILDDIKELTGSTFESDDPEEIRQLYLDGLLSQSEARTLLDAIKKKGAVVFCD